MLGARKGQKVVRLLALKAWAPHPFLRGNDADIAKQPILISVVRFIRFALDFSFRGRNYRRCDIGLLGRRWAADDRPVGLDGRRGEIETDFLGNGGDFVALGRIQATPDFLTDTQGDFTALLVAGPAISTGGKARDGQQLDQQGKRCKENGLAHGNSEGHG